MLYRIRKLPNGWAAFRPVHLHGPDVLHMQGYQTLAHLLDRLFCGAPRSAECYAAWVARRVH